MSAATILQALQEFALDCHAEYLDEPDIPVEARVILLAAVRECRRQLADFEKVLEADVVAQAKDRRFTVPGVGEVEIRSTTKRTQWQHADLLAAVVSRTIDSPETLYDVETGELLPYAVIAQNVAREVAACFSLGAGKLTGLRQLGLDADEYCTVEQGAKSVSIPR
jgi:hypothetical protein